MTLVALGALVGASSLSRATHSSDLALTIASDRMEEMRAGGYAALPATGTFSHDLLPTLSGGNAAQTITDYNDETKQVVVSVSWQEPGEAARTVSLSTLVTETGGLP